MDEIQPHDANHRFFSALWGSMYRRGYTHAHTHTHMLLGCCVCFRLVILFYCNAGATEHPHACVRVGVLARDPCMAACLAWIPPR